MKKELKELLDNYLIKYYTEELVPQNYIKNLTEFLLESPIILSKIDHQRRWYNVVERIAQIDEEVFIKFYWYSAHGDSSISDMDLTLDLTTIEKVLKKEKTITVIYYE